MKLIKRNGNIENFNINKVIKAVEAAFHSTNTVVPLSLSRDLVETFNYVEAVTDSINVEEIQDRVENFLMEHRFYKVAKAYILYREQHKQA